MDIENNIIAIRKKDIVKAHQAFEDLMCTTERMLNDFAIQNSTFFKGISSTKFEKFSVCKIQEACAGTPFSAEDINLISGHKFPDIVASGFYGIEVKQTEKNSWTSIGSSIVETTRVENVDDIYMLFGKFGGNVAEFKCRPYQDVLHDIAITHSPRYLINMELKAGESIFDKMGTTYDDFRTSENSIAKARQYYRKKAAEEGKTEMPWWLTNDNVEEPHSFNITLWGSLTSIEKKRLQQKCMILFPEALNPHTSRTKYNNTTLWLCSYNQVVNPNIRDMYSAGGKITHVDGVKLQTPVAQVFNTIVEYADDIKKILDQPSAEMMAMIIEFNPKLLKGDNLYEQWLKQCNVYAKTYNVPLEEWISNKPTFKFSKK